MRGLIGAGFQLAQALRAAGGMAYCEENPQAQECRENPVVAQSISADLMAEMERIHGVMARGYGGSFRGGRRVAQGDRGGESWRMIPEGQFPGSKDDCEERMLWGLRELRRGPLGRAARPLMLRSRSNPREMPHVVVGVETPGGTMILDPAERQIRQRDYYQDSDAYAPEQGIGGRWTRR